MPKPSFNLQQMDSSATPSHSPPKELRDGDSLASLIQSILLSVPDAMIVIDQRGVILAFSSTAETLFGYNSNEIIGENVRILTTETDSGHHDQYIRNYLTTNEKQIIGVGRIVQARRADGHSIPVELKIGEAVVNGERYFTGFIRDISEQQANTHRMAEMQVELSNFSRLTTVGTMASAMAHELNQPLTAVANYLEASVDLLDDLDENKIEIVREALQAATQQSVRAGQIVRRLRDYVSRGELELRPEPLKVIIEDAISLAKVGIEGPLARVVLNHDERVSNVLADKLQLRQVFVNLIKNAIEALSDTNTPMIWIDVVNEGESVNVRIKDNGPGLSDDIVRAPFEVFKSTKLKGMGLGLSICMTIIEAHGSTIDVENLPEGGAQFSFALRPSET